MRGAGAAAGSLSEALPPGEHGWERWSLPCWRLREEGVVLGSLSACFNKAVQMDVLSSCLVKPCAALQPSAGTGLVTVLCGDSARMPPFTGIYLLTTFLFVFGFSNDVFVSSPL